MSGVVKRRDGQLPRWEILSEASFGPEALAWDGPGYEQTVATREGSAIAFRGDALEKLVAQANAAATLLEALENLENDDGHIPRHAWDTVQAAIAKAKGEDT